jgi:hypothetical protein
MKITSTIPPVLALALVGVWITYQRQSISAEEGASASLQKQILVARSSGPGADPTRSKNATSASAAEDKAPLDWKKNLTQFAEMEQNDGSSDRRAMVRLNECLESMSKEELLAALDDIAALVLSHESRFTLECSVMGQLMARDPEFGMNCYVKRLQNDPRQVSWSLCNALQEWAEKDMAKATAWFDQQIAAGKFDSKSLDGKMGVRDEAEAGLIGILLRSAPEAAARRLSAMPEDQRAEVFVPSSLQFVNEENQVALASLIRSQVAGKDQPQALAHQVDFLVGGDGYARVNEYMDRISATPAERMACIEQAAQSQIRQISSRGKFTREDLDTLRQWTMTQAPDSTDRITGQALARSKLDFAAASEWILSYHQASGNDDLITSFLNGGSSRKNKEQARALAAQITDVKRRDEILKKLQ